MEKIKIYSTMVCYFHHDTMNHKAAVHWLKRSGPGVTKKSPLAIFEVSFVYNFISIQAIIMQFGTRFRRLPPEPCATLHGDRCITHYVIHDFVLTEFR